MKPPSKRVLCGLFVPLLLWASCQTTSGPHDWKLMSDETIGVRGASQSEYVVLIFNPDDCFSCYGVLANWFAWRTLDGGDVDLILTRVPTVHERRAMILSGIREQAILRDKQPVSTPAELLFRSGVLVSMQEGVTSPDHSRLLLELAHRRREGAND